MSHVSTSMGLYPIFRNKATSTANVSCELTWSPQWPSNKPAVDRKLTSTKLILKWVSSTRSANGFNVSALLWHFV
jgi:hypothetical protein